MKKILKAIFPIKLNFAILQLEEYKYLRFLKWILKNFFKRSVPSKKPFVITQKVKYLAVLFTLISLAFPLLTLLITKSLLASFIVLLILLTQPYITLLFSLLLLKPYEMYNKNKTIENTRKKVTSFKNLKVIGITGSFGKSSTKEILYQILKAKFDVLKTPESFNTIFGIAKVVDLELDKNHEYFICEMAAYNIGEINTLTYMVPPTYGILTGITTQHFERFGSLENTIKAKFELVDAVKDKTNMVFNLNDENIQNELTKRKITNPTGFLKAQNIKFDKNGSSFDLFFGPKKYSVKTKLFGFASVKNIEAASSMAHKLGLSPSYIVERIKSLNPVDNRFVLSQTDGKAVIVNNTYSSNPQGFRETINTAKNIKGKKVLVTPGLVELGEMEKQTHIDLGVYAQNIFDKIVLVGKNNRTVSFSKGLNNEKIVEFIEDNREDYFNTINKLKKEFDWIFLENDVTQNY
ncbi:MAG TPA: UDP-N-acetylmuramoyl-tripeptide--D-alanyl-D-alanine ligase [Patescibacteria group bacterium]